jgi:hypothetical protein
MKRKMQRYKLNWAATALLLVAVSSLKSQERLGIVTENYSGIGNIFINPANSAHTPFQFDLNFGTASFFLNNRVLNLPSSTFAETFGGDSLSLSLADFKYGSAEVKLLYKFPSLALRFENFTIGAFSNFRFAASGKNFPNEIGKKLLKGFDPSYANTSYKLKKHEFASLGWQESGFNISRVANYFTHERLYFGANIKFLNRGAGFYFGSDNAYDFTILDSLHYFVQQYGGLIGRGNKGWGVSGDLGLKFVKFEKGPWFSNRRNENEKLYNNYIFSAGISLIDLGWMKFRKGQSTQFLVNNINVEIDTSILNNLSYPDPTAMLVGALGNLQSAISSSSATVEKFSMQMPTTLSYQVDWQPLRYLYLNLTGKVAVPLFSGGRLPAAGMVAFTPRLETKKLMIAIPFSLYRYKEPTFGLAIRYRGLTVGSDVMATGNRTTGFNHVDFYFSFKLSIEEMEHTFLKPPVPPPIHMIEDTVALPEWGYMNKPSFKPTESGRIYYSKNTMRADTVFVSDLEGNTVGKMLAATRPQKKRWYKPWKYGFGFRITTNYKMNNLKTGVYVFDKKIPFIVKPEQAKEILVVIPTNEFTANNMAGGRSLHQAEKGRKPGSIVSFYRPSELSDFEKLLPLINFFKSDTSLHVGYISEKDLDASSALKDAKVVIIAGNSSHWTRRARQNFDKYVDKGGNVIVVSKDFMKWQVRYRQKGTQMICHKNKFWDLVQDPYLKTTNWDDQRLDYPRPPRIETDSINTTLPGTETDSLLQAVFNNPVVKLFNANKSNLSKLNIEVAGLKEKNIKNQVLLTGDSEKSSVPIFISKAKATSGKYIQFSNLGLLDPAKPFQKNIWIGLLKYTGGIQ